VPARVLQKRRLYGTFLCRGPVRAGLHSTGLSAAREQAGRMTGRRLGAGLAGDVPARDHVCINAANHEPGDALSIVLT
jgi:hypothetical protein